MAVVAAVAVAGRKTGLRVVGVGGAVAWPEDGSVDDEWVRLGRKAGKSEEEGEWKRLWSSRLRVEALPLEWRAVTAGLGREGKGAWVMVGVCSGVEVALGGAEEDVAVW